MLNKLQKLYPAWLTNELDLLAWPVAANFVVVWLLPVTQKDGQILVIQRTAAMAGPFLLVTIADFKSLMQARSARTSLCMNKQVCAAVSLKILSRYTWGIQT